MRYTDLQLATSLSKKWENENDLLEMEEFEYQEREVDRNSRGFVRWMQESLNKVLGLRLTVDGNLGPATRSAIRSFQQKQGLSVDGSAGAKTEAAIKAALQGFQIPPQAEPLNTAPAIYTPPTEQSFQRTVYGWSSYKKRVQDLPADQQAILKGLGDAIVASYKSGEQPVKTVKVYGHADWDNPRNSVREQQMSDERAGMVINWLKNYVDTNIATKIRWESKGFGATKLKAQPTTEANRRFNRRVEISLITQEQVISCCPPKSNRDLPKWLQKSLNQVLGLRIPVNGVFDVQTQSALRSFQYKQRLSPTGQLNQATIKVLMNQCMNSRGIIPIREFIHHIQIIEQAYPQKTPQEILTMIRKLYYGSPAGSPAFDQLIPDAPFAEKTGSVYRCIDSEDRICNESTGTCICVYADGLKEETPELQQSIRRLREHANENACADNPSPYLQVNHELIDVGHLFVGVDAILHPRTSIPFSSYGIGLAPGPATWVGDVGAAMVYLKEHEENGRKSSDVEGSPSPTIEFYYRNSMPREDMLGDVDAFNMAEIIRSKTVSQALYSMYISESGGAPRYLTYRWRNFVSHKYNQLTYIRSGNTITWTNQARETVINQIKRFSDLFYYRKSLRAIVQIPIQNWPKAPQFAERFLQDIKRGLEEEINRNP